MALVTTSVRMDIGDLRKWPFLELKVGRKASAQESATIWSHLVGFRNLSFRIPPLQ